MSDTSGPSTWAEMWTDAQQKTMQAWAGLLRDKAPPFAGFPGAGASGNPLAEGFEYWNRMALGALPEQARELTERYFGLSKNYLQMGEHLWSLMQQTQTLADSGKDWQEAWQTQLHEFQKSLAAGSGQSGTMNGLGTFWGMPLQHWRQLASSLSVLPGDVEKSLRGEGPPGQATFQRAVRSALSTPALGYTREWQEDAQEWMQLWMNYGQALQAYESAFGKVTKRTLELFGNRMTDMLKRGESYASMRDAYNACVECAETAYAESATTREFANIQARLTNSMMALKKHEQQVVAEMQSAAGIPTRREMNTTQGRVQEMRREIRALRHRVEDLEEALEDVADLRRKVAALKAAGSGAPPARRKAAAKRAAPKAKARTRTTKTTEK